MSFIDRISTQEVLQIVKQQGPVIPVRIRKAAGKGDSITIGAALSELLKKGSVKYTNVRIGGSPFYYVSGQEKELEKLNEYLNEKDKRTFQLLKEKKVLRDKILEPLTRVSCRNIPDYAKKITVNVNGEKEIFWRYYLITEEEAINEIRNLFKKKEDTIAKPSQLAQKSNENKEQKTEETQKPIEKPVETQKSLTEPVDKSEFENKIRTFFDSNNIKVIEREVIRKNSEYEFVISMQTPVGSSKYFLKARNKKKCNDGDLSEAYLRGTIKRLPTVFLTTGEVAKKSMDKLETDYKGLIIKKI